MQMENERKIIIHIINHLYNSKEFHMLKHGDIFLVNIGHFIFQIWKCYPIRYLQISSVIWIRSCSIIKTRIWWRSMQSSYHFLWRSWSIQRGIDNYWTTTNLKMRVKISLGVFNIFKVGHMKGASIYLQCCILWWRGYWSVSKPLWYWNHCIREWRWW